MKYFDVFLMTNHPGRYYTCFLDVFLSPGDKHIAVGRRRLVMATIQPKGEKVRNAVKWISIKLKEDEKRKIAVLIQEAAMKFNLSPKEEEFIENFYKEGCNQEFL